MLAGLSGGFLTFFISMSMLLGRFISSIIKRQWNQQSPKYAISVVLIDLIWLFSTFTMWSIIQIFLFAQHKLLISLCHHASAMIFQKQSLSMTGICTVWHQVPSTNIYHELLNGQFDAKGDFAQKHLLDLFWLLVTKITKVNSWRLW